MEGIVRGEVGLIDLVLAIGISRDQRNDLMYRVLGDDGELYLDKCVRHIAAVSFDRMINRRRSLATVDDLQPGNCLDCHATRAQIDHLDMLGCGGNTVVIPQKSLWL